MDRWTSQHAWRGRGCQAAYVYRGFNFLFRLSYLSAQQVLAMISALAEANISNAALSPASCRHQAEISSAAFDLVPAAARESLHIASSASGRCQVLVRKWCRDVECFGEGCWSGKEGRHKLLFKEASRRERMQQGRSPNAELRLICPAEAIGHTEVHSAGRSSSLVTMQITDSGSRAVGRELWQRPSCSERALVLVSVDPTKAASDRTHAPYAANRAPRGP